MAFDGLAPAAGSEPPHAVAGGAKIRAIPRGLTTSTWSFEAVPSPDQRTTAGLPS